MLQLEEHVLKGPKLQGEVSSFYFLRWEIISEGKEEVSKQFLQVAGSRAGKWKCLKRLIPEMDGSDFYKDFRSFPHAYCKRSANMNDAHGKFSKVGQM